MACKFQENGKVIEEPRELKSIGEYDVVVCGGGMAGFGSAVAAARQWALWVCFSSAAWSLSMAERSFSLSAAEQIRP